MLLLVCNEALGGLEAFVANCAMEIVALGREVRPDSALGLEPTPWAFRTSPSLRLGWVGVRAHIDGQFRWFEE